MSANLITDEQTTPVVNSATPVNAPVRIAVSVRHLSKIYPVQFARLKKFFRRPVQPPVEALTDVSLDVAEGEIFGLIGRNGAGKTTLAKIIATLVQPTQGEVTVKDHDSVRDEEFVRSQVGLASAEERSFYWRLTAEQNLMFFARLYGLSDHRARARINELLARFELESMRRRRFGELSTGNKQRMAVARALLNSPPILLLDEPTRSLDPVAARAMRSLIGELSKSDPPTTILLTSHNLTEIEELSTRVAIISRGRIRALDTPRNLRRANRPRENVRLEIQNISPARATEILSARLDELRANEQDGNTIISFTRQAGDDDLDFALRALHREGAHVLSCDAERATLLDVLEEFERDREKPS